MGSPKLPLMLLALYQVHLSVSGCTDLYKTIQFVHDCPRTEPEWNIAAIRKKCDVVCPQSKYHCVISKDMNATMEVCAEPKYLQGHCAYFSVEEDRIRDLLTADCSQYTIPCPSRYLSTDAFKYTACYDLIKLYVAQPVQTTSKSMTYTTYRRRQTEETSNTWMILAIIIPCIIILISGTIGLILFIQRRKQLRTRRPEQPKHISDLEKELEPLTSNEEKISTENENKSDSTEVEKLKKQCDEKDTELAKLRKEIETLSKAYVTETEEKEELKQKQEKEKLDLQQQYLAKNEECKELNNKLQEAKGNIRVLCRIRKTDGEDKCLTVVENSIHVFAKPAGKSIKKFTFEKVFKENSTQKDVYSEIRELVQNFLDGYNLCIFAYGQTGSGKTYTMDGGSESEDAEGVIPRAIKQVFEDSEAAKCGGWIYEFSASYLELYNEKIRDLAKGIDVTKPSEIKGVVNGKVQVTNLTTCEVHTKEEVMQFYKEAFKNRTSSKTSTNEKSSRSHAVFRLEMTGKVIGVQDRKDSCSGTLTLVDLAGSEKMDQQAGTTTNLETNKINLSLLELGKVLRSLLKKENVTYRSSVLTRLLGTSLGGNSKTLMIVNVSPSMACQRETERSLEFGSEVSRVVLDRARKNK